MFQICQIKRESSSNNNNENIFLKCSLPFLFSFLCFYGKLIFIKVILHSTFVLLAIFILFSLPFYFWHTLLLLFLFQAWRASFLYAKISLHELRELRKLQNKPFYRRSEMPSWRGSWLLEKRIIQKEIKEMKMMTWN